MMADIRMLQEQSQQLQNLLGTLTEALKAVNTRLDQQAEANRKAFADQKLVIDNLTNDLRVIREKLDDNNVRVGSLAQEVDALRQSVQQLSAPRPSAPSRPAAPAPPAAPRRPTAPPPAAAGAAGVGASPQKLLDGALADYTPASTISRSIGFESLHQDLPEVRHGRRRAGPHRQLRTCRTARTTRRSTRTTSSIRTYPNERHDSRGVLPEGPRAAEPEADSTRRARSVRVSS